MFPLRIGGPGLGILYSVANALLFCFLAGAMIALCADAVCTGLEILLQGFDVRFVHPTLRALNPPTRRN